MALAIGFASITVARSAQAAATQLCERSIVSCGCTITSGGYYEVDASLLSTQGLTSRGECIAIKADNVLLNLQASQISGPGGAAEGSASIGVHIQPGANNNFIEGSGALIDGWSVGLLIEGSQNDIEFFDANNNDVAGVVLEHASGNNITDFVANNNGEYGVWLLQSNSNQINCANADNNASSGIYLGCSGSKNGIVGCRRNGVNTDNHLFNLMIDTNGAYGILLDSGNRHTTVSDVSAQGNSLADLGDRNAGCGSDMWFGNSFNSVSQNCVDPTLR